MQVWGQNNTGTGLVIGISDTDSFPSEFPPFIQRIGKAMVRETGEYTFTWGMQEFRVHLLSKD